MPQFSFTQNQIEGVIGKLRELNTQFKDQVRSLEAKQQELGNKWQGDANTVFNSVFQNDKAKWDDFARAIDEYIDSLERIKNIYAQKEAEAAALLKNQSS